MPPDPAAAPRCLAELRGLRSAPPLDPEGRRVLREELDRQLGACEWFTVGVMAPSAAAAVATLRSTETALGWAPLDPDTAGTAAGMGDDPSASGVFLKGNQSSGRFQLRAEAGLGEGILISGHGPAGSGGGDTWGPLPLDFFDR